MRNFIFLSIFSAFFVYDIFVDIKEEIPFTHIWHELFLLSLSLMALIWQIIVISHNKKQITQLNRELLEGRESWQQFHQKNLTHAQAIRDSIDQQFVDWHLSQGEKDVALLLIKGFAMKEIANLRQTHEKTVRQQASSIYRKSGLSGRQELSAFFLEDILSVPILAK